MIAKNPPYRNPELIAAVKGMACVRCDIENGTTAPAHYSGIGDHLLGKGGGIKAHDFPAAYCHECHSKADNYHGGNTYETGFFRVMDILRTLYVLLRDGKIRIEVVK